MRKFNKSIESDQDLTAVLNQIKLEIGEFKTGGKNEQMFPQRWLPTAIGILPEAFSEENKLINTTLKVVRSRVEEYFQSELNYLYSAEGKEISNAHNVDNLRTFLTR